MVKTDAKHHPRIYLQDSASATSQLLIDRFANKPKWAPQGKRIAFTVWKSLERPWELCVVTLGKADTLYPAFGAHTVKYRWSPNGKFLAVQGTLYGEPRSVLLIVETSHGKATALDTLQLLSDYDFGWSPDSRAVAASRPTRLASMEEVAEAELWVFDVGGRGARLVPGSGFVNQTPQWIDEKRLLFTRAKPGEQSGETLVLDVVRHKAAR